MSATIPFTTVGPVSAKVAKAVRKLVAASTRHDGVAPISEQPLRQLSDRRAQVAHSLVIQDNRLVGYAQIDIAVPGRATAEIAVAPQSRGTGIGASLLRSALSAAKENDSTLAVWAYGNMPAARHLLEGAGLKLTRELLRLEVPLNSARPVLPISEQEQSVLDRIRTFQPGVDDKAWLETNALAFQWHPEQGRLDQGDLDARMSEDWFDPELFFVIDSVPGAAPGKSISAYSWLKVLPGAETGEIYVVGVSPDAQNQGLGRALMRHSLTVLQERGLTAADLYVEADNGPALAMYLTQGFTVAQRHGQYSQV